MASRSPRLLGSLPATSTVRQPRAPRVLRAPLPKGEPRGRGGEQELPSPAEGICRVDTSGSPLAERTWRLERSIKHGNDQDGRLAVRRVASRPWAALRLDDACATLKGIGHCFLRFEAA